MLIDIAHAVGGYLHDVFVGNADWGILIGYFAQALFAMRFVVQWIASERAGKSVIEGEPKSAMADVYRTLAGRILTEKDKKVPDSLEDEDLRKLTQ